MTQSSPIPLVGFLLSCHFIFTFRIHSDGVRAGAKRLGRKKQLTDAQKELMLQHRLSPPNPCCTLSFLVFGLIHF